MITFLPQNEQHYTFYQQVSHKTTEGNCHTADQLNQVATRVQSQL